MKLNVIYSAVYGNDVHPFDRFSSNVEQVNSPDQLTDVNSALVIWGGSDIEPSLYGHEKALRTHTHPQRCKTEWALLQEAIKKGITIFGVCRGAQMLCAAAGGYLLQHVDNHVGAHNVVTYQGDTIRVNSIHHQMMAGLEKVDHELLAWSEHQRSKQYIYKKDQVFEIPEGWKEPEYVYFPKIKGHAVQWHPEMMSETERATQFIFNEIEARLYDHCNC